jgi:PIN domain nuclease of toxin-antitoxin system
MRVLLDTHVLLWYLDGETLPTEVVEILENAANQRIVSIVSLWELSIKISLINSIHPKHLTKFISIY